MADKEAVKAFRGGLTAWHSFVDRHLQSGSEEPIDLSESSWKGSDFAGGYIHKVGLNFDRCTFDSFLIQGAVFPRGASFKGAIFNGPVKIKLGAGSGGTFCFSGAIFKEDVRVEDWAAAPHAEFDNAKLERGLYAGIRADGPPVVWPWANFTNAEIAGTLFLDGCKFGAHATFEGAKLQTNQLEDSVSVFSNAIFTRSADFSNAVFYGRALFANAQFLGPTFFQEATFHKAPDFHSAVLHQGTQFSPQHRLPSLFLDTTSDGAANAYRTLKLAMNAQQALSEESAFFLLEMRSRARAEPFSRRVFYWMYDVLSVYGQSVRRPLLCYLAVTLLFGGIYSLLAGQRWEAFNSDLTALTLYGAVPFAAALRWPEVNPDTGSALFSSNALIAVQVAIVLQSILSAILLFLVGLGLRNMFRIK